MPELVHSLSILNDSLRQALTEAPEVPLPETPQVDQGLADWARENPSLGFPNPPRCKEAAEACRAGLWLLAGYLDESHSISQQLHTPEGSLWHGVMHRQEGDYSNAKYWFGQVRRHPFYARCGVALAQSDQDLAPLEVERLLRNGQYCPETLVDLGRDARRGKLDPTLVRSIRDVAWLEWQTLFECCLEQAWGD
jgi:hypothetical protein